jgi:hypothetical protein
VLEEAGQALLDDPLTSQLGQALRSGKLSEAGARANDLADQLMGSSEEELDLLIENLAETAAALEDIDPELASFLIDAVDSLSDGRLEDAAQALQQAAGSLQKTAQQQAAANLATGAADRLDQGRIQIAQVGQGQTDGAEIVEGDGQVDHGQGQAAGDFEGDGEQSSDTSHSESSQPDGLPGGMGPGGGHADNVFIPDYIDLGSEEGVEIELPAECAANPQDCGALITENPTIPGYEDSLVPYNQVYGDYRQAAYQALEDQYIPLGLRDYVRDYFASLEP